MRWAAQSVLIANLVAIAASCAHVSSSAEPTEDGFTAVKAWTDALYPGPVSFADRTWWIGDAARRELAQQSVPACAPPPLLHDPPTQYWTDVPPELQVALCECAYDKFMPMILQEMHDPRWKELARPGAIGRGLHGIIGRDAQAWIDHEYAMDESVFERLRGARRDRPPAVEEMAVGLLLTADAIEQRLADMETVDPGGHLHAEYVDFADVPLTLAPLFALSTGVDPDDVQEALRACFESFCDARLYLNTPRLP